MRFIGCHVALLHSLLHYTVCCTVLAVSKCVKHDEIWNTVPKHVEAEFWCGTRRCDTGTQCWVHWVNVKAWKFQPISSTFSPSKSHFSVLFGMGPPSRWPPFEHSSTKLGSLDIDLVYSTLCPRITLTRSTSKFRFNMLQYSVSGLVMLDAFTYGKDCITLLETLSSCYGHWVEFCDIFKEFFRQSTSPAMKSRTKSAWDIHNKVLHLTKKITVLEAEYTGCISYAALQFEPAHFGTKPYGTPLDHPLQEVTTYCSYVTTGQLARYLGSLGCSLWLRQEW